jgi:uncharacterized membrane protein YdbT with pleckstrin-like domain
VLPREGVLHQQQRDIPISRVNQVSSKQTRLDRILGSATLTVESAGERGQSALRDIPGVVRVQKTVYELAETDEERNAVSDQDLREALRDAAEQ